MPDALDRLINLWDFERAAEAALEPMAWRYFSGGAGDERTLRENRLAFERPGFVERAQRGVDRLAHEEGGIVDDVVFDSGGKVSRQLRHGALDAGGGLRGTGGRDAPTTRLLPARRTVVQARGRAAGQP